ncbi:hypothetical protein S245_069981 [Arachis hypogaea]
MSLTIKLHLTSQLNNLRHKSKHNLAKSIYNVNPLITIKKCKVKQRIKCNNSNKNMIKSSLIDPDAGTLVDLIVPESQRDSKMAEVESMAKVNLTRYDVEWVHVISEGWASPLRGFMRESEYLQSLHFNCLRMEDGSVVNMPLLIVLAIDDETKGRIG